MEKKREGKGSSVLHFLSTSASYLRGWEGQGIVVTVETSMRRKAMLLGKLSSYHHRRRLSSSYTAGYFGMKPSMERGTLWLNTDFTEMAAAIQKTGVPEALQIGDCTPRWIVLL